MQIKKPGSSNFLVNSPVMGFATIPQTEDQTPRPRLVEPYTTKNKFL